MFFCLFKAYIKVSWWTERRVINHLAAIRKLPKRERNFNLNSISNRERHWLVQTNNFLISLEVKVKLHGKGAAVAWMETGWQERMVDEEEEEEEEEKEKEEKE